MMSNFLKFVMASGLGFLLDMALALVLNEKIGLALWLAATVSFFAVACVNYLLFEFWIFRVRGRSVSLVRLAGVLVASVVAVLARVGTILALSAPLALFVQDRGLNIMLLLCGGGVSVIVNFILNRRLVFAEKG